MPFLSLLQDFKPSFVVFPMDSSGVREPEEQQETNLSTLSGTSS